MEFSNVVQPVSIVDQDITLATAGGTPLLGAATSQGQLAAPAAGTLLADSGAIATAGNYFIVWTAAADNATIGNSATMLMQRRNAANGANIWEAMFSLSANVGFGMQVCRVTVVANERIRFVVGPSAQTGTVEVTMWTVTA